MDTYKHHQNKPKINTMNNIMTSSDFVAQFDSHIAITNKSRLLALLLTICGAALLFVAHLLREAEDLSTVVMTIGVVVLAVGVVKCIRPGSKITHKATGEHIRRELLGFESEQRAEAERALSEGRFEELKKLVAKGSSAPVVAVIYTTPSGGVKVGQLLHYVPYQYEPLTKVYSFIK